MKQFNILGDKFSSFLMACKLNTFGVRKPLSWNSSVYIEVAYLTAPLSSVLRAPGLEGVGVRLTVKMLLPLVMKYLPVK